MNLKLFMQLAKSTIFHFGDKPARKLIKSDSSHYVAPEGPRLIHPHVLVFPETKTEPRQSIYDQSEGDKRNGSNNDC